MRAISGLGLLLVSGCGFSEERFLVKGVERWCEVSAACAGTFEASDCIDVFRSTDRSGCTYDEESARTCFDAIEEAECINDSILGISRLDVPESCERVYTCPEE